MKLSSNRADETGACFGYVTSCLRVFGVHQAYAGGSGWLGDKVSRNHAENDVSFVAGQVIGLIFGQLRVFP